MVGLDRRWEHAGWSSGDYYDLFVVRGMNEAIASALHVGFAVALLGLLTFASTEEALHKGLSVEVNTMMAMMEISAINDGRVKS